MNRGGRKKAYKRRGRYYDEFGNIIDALSLYQFEVVQNVSSEDSYQGYGGDFSGGGASDSYSSDDGGGGDGGGGD